MFYTFFTDSNCKDDFAKKKKHDFFRAHENQPSKIAEFYWNSQKVLLSESSECEKRNIRPLDLVWKILMFYVKVKSSLKQTFQFRKLKLYLYYQN